MDHTCPLYLLWMSDWLVSTGQPLKEVQVQPRPVVAETPKYRITSMLTPIRNRHLIYENRSQKVSFLSKFLNWKVMLERTSPYHHLEEAELSEYFHPAVAPTTNGYYLHWCSSTLSCCSTYNKWLLSTVVFEYLHPAVAPTTNGYYLQWCSSTSILL
jgi:hypothetical protein